MPTRHPSEEVDRPAGFDQLLAVVSIGMDVESFIELTPKMEEARQLLKAIYAHYKTGRISYSFAGAVARLLTTRHILRPDLPVYEAASRRRLYGLMFETRSEKARQSIQQLEGFPLYFADLPPELQ